MVDTVDPSTGDDFGGAVVVDAFGVEASLGEVYSMAQFIGMRSAALACAIAARSVFLHARRNGHPQIRRCIVCILLLVPVYAADACCGLHRIRPETPRVLMREAYEACALVSFMWLIMTCIGGRTALARRLDARPCRHESRRRWRPARVGKIMNVFQMHRQIRVIMCWKVPPVYIVMKDAPKAKEAFFSSDDSSGLTSDGSMTPATPDVCDEKLSRGGAQFVRRMELGVLQYVVLCGGANTIIALLAWSNGFYHAGRFEVTDAYPYCSALQFVSQSWALWSMVQLIHCTQRHLAELQPVRKFMCVKGLIYISWLQSVVMLVLENLSSLRVVRLWLDTKRECIVSHWWDPIGFFTHTRVENHRTDAWQGCATRNLVCSGIGSFVLCLEILAFAVLVYRAYPCSEWDPGDRDCTGHRLLAGRVGYRSRSRDWEAAGEMSMEEGSLPMSEVDS
mmetsp:Transcript_87334/g.168030  ORF Transcript_87334/g.168030 Transcript_87334/m.168030 type:complete len:450 (-) Transcript_87334:148-1497(-)|eukprot:CAMPEP_0172753476 /NCGR_PEP_ID=MMETSP1074-20121228/156020_1 /TAXON_ID=2916 /ORGANISM="Ceratium fusus, Strain PA161109" /LENGTH=449 /DNA_ID=CAMNT_0013586163 /DNA_START=118 /DNA_END=1467 /DNA_ORIENTATION=+